MAGFLKEGVEISIVNKREKLGNGRERKNESSAKIFQKHSGKKSYSLCPDIYDGDIRTNRGRRTRRLPGGEVVTGLQRSPQSGNTTNVTAERHTGRFINWTVWTRRISRTLQFVKDSGGFAVLNRVVEGGATQSQRDALGNQGHIIIVNPHGIVFGPTAFVDAYQFTASAHDITNGDFMNGIYQFSGGEGSVINHGRIIGHDEVSIIGRSILKHRNDSMPRRVDYYGRG